MDKDDYRQTSYESNEDSRQLNLPTTDRVAPPPPKENSSNDNNKEE